MSEKNQEIIDRVNNSEVESDLAELRAKRLLAYMEQYANYYQGVRETVLIAESMMAVDGIRQALDELNNRSKDVKYEIFDAKHSVEIKETFK